METLFTLPPAPELDYARHNAEQARVWASFHQGNPERVPMYLGMNPRVLLCDYRYNPRHVSFADYWNDPEIMLQVQCEFAYFRRHYLPFDQEMGMPEQWEIYVDTQNVAEAAWLGAEVVFPEGDVPDTRVLLTDERKNALFDRGIPDPFSGLMEQVKQYHAYFGDGRHTFMGRPVRATPALLGTDGPMTIACNLRGTAEFCMDLYTDTDYALQLLEFITQATIERLRAWYTYYGMPVPDNFWFADDSIALLSTKDYERFVLPFHKKLLAGVTTGNGHNHTMHLCGDATRHFPLIRDTLHVGTFDTGYPVRHGELLRDLGAEITVFGGPRVDVLQNGTPEQVRAATRKILDEVMPVSKRFILRDANNVPPGTPLENLQAMYDTVKTDGRYAR